MGSRQRSSGEAGASDADDDVEVVDGEIVSDSKYHVPASPEDSLPPVRGVISTYWWESIRYRSIRSLFESYEKALRAAAASVRAEADLRDARLEHLRAKAKLDDLDAILADDAQRRKRGRRLAKLQDEKDLTQLQLEIARNRKSIADLQRGKKDGPSTARKEQDVLGAIREAAKRRREIEEEIERIVQEEMKRAGVDSEDELPPEVRTEIKNMREVLQQTASRNWHQPD